MRNSSYTNKRTIIKLSQMVDLNVYCFIFVNIKKEHSSTSFSILCGNQT